MKLTIIMNQHMLDLIEREVEQFRVELDGHDVKCEANHERTSTECSGGVVARFSARCRNYPINVCKNGLAYITDSQFKNHRCENCRKNTRLCWRTFPI